MKKRADEIGLVANVQKKRTAVFDRRSFISFICGLLNNYFFRDLFAIHFNMYKINTGLVHLFLCKT